VDEGSKRTHTCRGIRKRVEREAKKGTYSRSENEKRKTQKLAEGWRIVQESNTPRESIIGKTSGIKEE